MDYESVLVMDPALSSEWQKRFFQKIEKVVAEFKGHIHHVDSWGLRKLANKNKYRWSQALYFHFSFKGSRGVVEELIRQIKLDEKKILYYYFEKLSEKKSALEHLQDFRDLTEESIKREEERQAKIQKRKAFLASKKQ